MAHVTSPASDLPETPELSVVISVYNGEDRLEASLRSVLEQQGPSFEVILINDGSGPKATAILREIAARDRRVRLIEQENTGLTRALIRGCAVARAPIIVRHDADDTSLQGRFAALAEAFHQHPAASLATTWAAAHGPRGEPLYLVTRPRDPAVFRRLLLDCALGMPAHGATAFRRNHYIAVGGYREEFYFAQDNDLWWRLASAGTSICVPQCLYQYCIEPTATSGKHAAHQKMYAQLGIACHRARMAGLDESELLAQARSVREHPCPPARQAYGASLYFLGACLAKRRDARCITYLWRAWLRNPFSLRYLARATGGLATIFMRARPIDAGA